MNEYERRESVDEYIGRLERALEDVPAGERHELVAEVRGHIDEAWSAASEHNRATLLGILDRLGEPEVLAREYRERLGPEAPTQPEGPDLLSIAAVVLTWLFWPIGLLLAWLSPRWSARDKLVATAIPVSGLLLLVMLLVPVTVVTSAGPPPTVVDAPERLISTVLVLYGLWGASFLAAVFLALRRLPRPRTGAFVAPALAAIVTIGGVAILLLLA